MEPHHCMTVFQVVKNFIKLGEVFGGNNLHVGWLLVVNTKIASEFSVSIQL